MNSTSRIICGCTTAFPPLRQPKPEIADRGTVRLGSCCITAGFPPLRQPKPEIADRGTVRLGSCCITAGFPPLRQPKPEIADRGTVRLGSCCITRRLPAAAAAQARDRRSRHRAARQLLHHRRLPVASLGSSTVAAGQGASTMAKQAESIICRFYRLIPDAPVPRRADRSADGMLPTRGYRYCEALASASAFGWYIYPPLNFSLVWDGVEIAWTYEGAEDWYPLRGTQFPGFRQLFEEMAPDPGQTSRPDFSGRRERARCRADLERLPGADGAGLGIAVSGSRQHPANPRLRAFRRHHRVGNLVRSALYQHPTDAHELAGRVPRPLSAVPGAAAAAPMLQRGLFRGRRPIGTECGGLAKF